MALALPHLAAARLPKVETQTSLLDEIPEWMGTGPYRHVQVLVVGWELRHVWEDLRRLDVPGISLARRESFFEALEWRPKVIVYNSDRGRPPIVGGLIGDTPPAFVAVGGDSLLAALAEGADAVFHLPEGVRDRHTRDRKARHQRRQVLKTMAAALRQGIYRVRQPCRASADGGLHLLIQGVLSMKVPVAVGSGLDLHIPPLEMLDRFSPGPTEGRQISEILAAGRVVDGKLEHPMPAVQQYLSGFPVDHVTAAGFMPQRALQALQLLRAEPRALDLAESNPVLFWLLIDEMQRRRKLPKQAVPLALAKQSVLLGKVLGQTIPVPQRKVKLCKRFELPSPLQPKHLAVVRRTLQSEPLSLGFRHWQRIPFRLLEMEDPLVPYSNWLRESSNLGTDPSLRQVQPLLRDTLDLAEELGFLPARVLQCPTRQQVVQLHDQLAEARNERQRALYRQRFVRSNSFPAPPLSGTQTIQPIRDDYALDQEGHEMHHCVGIYAKQMREGNRAFYRVLAPERATLELLRSPSGTWRISQLAGHCNARVAQKTKRAIYAWLAREQPGYRAPDSARFAEDFIDDIPF